MCTNPHLFRRWTPEPKLELSYLLCRLVRDFERAILSRNQKVGDFIRGCRLPHVGPWALMHSAQYPAPNIPQQIIRAGVNKKVTLVEMQIGNRLVAWIDIQAIISMNQYVETGILVHRLEEFKKEADRGVSPLRMPWGSPVMYIVKKSVGQLLTGSYARFCIKDIYLAPKGIFFETVPEILWNSKRLGWKVTSSDILVAPSILFGPQPTLIGRTL